MPFNEIIFSPRSLELASLVEWAHRTEGRDLLTLFLKLTTTPVGKEISLSPREVRAFHQAAILGLREVAYECKKKEEELKIKQEYDEIKKSLL